MKTITEKHNPAIFCDQTYVCFRCNMDPADLEAKILKAKSEVSQKQTKFIFFVTNFPCMQLPYFRILLFGKCTLIIILTESR